MRRDPLAVPVHDLWDCTLPLAAFSPSGAQAVAHIATSGLGIIRMAGRDRGMRSVSGGVSRSIVRGGAGLVVAASLLFHPSGIQGALAAEPIFSAPTATATWGEGIVFEADVTLTGPARRAELLLRSPLDETGAFVADTGPVEAGRRTLTYELAAGDGTLTPNTTYAGRWRLTFADGSVRIGPAVTVTYRDTRFRWRTLEGATVRIHWYEGSEAFGRRALGIAERAVASSAALLGVTESRRVDFFVYADEEAFYEALGPGTRENVGGQAIPGIRTLFALIPQASIDDGWVGIVIPHELAHLVFDTAVRNPYHYPPSWLNEGLAVYVAQGYDRSDRGLVRDAIKTRLLMPLEALTGQFPTTYDMFGLAYAESVSAVDFAVRTYGQAALVKLVRSYATGVSDDEALRAAFGVDLATFQKGWLADLGAPAPTRHGPNPPVTGLVPTEWNGPAPTAQTGAVDDVASPAASSGTDAGSAGEGSGATNPTVEGLAVGVLVGVAVAVIAVFVLRGRRRTSGYPPDPS